MRGLHTHASDRMREALVQALEARWEHSLRERAAIAPHSQSPCSTSYWPLTAATGQAPAPSLAPSGT